MGYHSRHKLDIEEIKSQTNEDIFKEIKDDENMGYCFDVLGEFGDNVKGYDLEDRLKEFSKKYPHKLFRLRREGEENWDITETIFVNGKFKTSKAEIRVETLTFNDL